MKPGSGGCAWTAVLRADLAVTSACPAPGAAQGPLLSRCLFFSFSFNP